MTISFWNLANISNRLGGNRVRNLKNFVEKVDFCSKMSKKSIFGKKCRKSLFLVKNVHFCQKKSIIGQKRRKRRILVKTEACALLYL